MVFFSCMCCESNLAGLEDSSRSCLLELTMMPAGPDVSRKDYSDSAYMHLGCGYFLVFSSEFS